MKRALLSLFFTLVATASSAHAADDKRANKNEPRSETETANEPAPPASPRDGLRFRAGLFGIAHAREGERAGDGASMGVAPGIALAPSYTYRNVDFSFDLRAALRVGEASRSDFQGTSGIAPGEAGDVSTGSPTTVFFSGGPRARWFPVEGALAPFFSGGLDALLFYTESLAGVGASLHLGTGLEIMHDDAHGRLSLELGIDLPTFRMRRGVEAKLDTWGASDKHVYIVPVTLAANWTF